MNEHANEVSTGGRGNKRRGERLVKVDNRVQKDRHAPLAVLKPHNRVVCPMAPKYGHLPRVLGDHLYNSVSNPS